MRIRAYAIALLIVISISSCVSLSPPDTVNKINVDNVMFPKFYWDQPLAELIALLGSPLTTSGQSDVVTAYYFKGYSKIEFPNVICCTVTSSSKLLRSISIFILSQHEDNPQLYFNEYLEIEKYINSIYGIASKTETFSLNKEPKYNGEELLNQRLTMITNFELANSVVIHTIMYDEEHMNHVMAWGDKRSQTMEETIEIFKNTSFAVLLKGKKK